VDWASVADEAESGVVSISVSGDAGSGQGSGVVIDDDGHVLTNNHVVAPAVDGGGIQVALSDARVFEAAVVGADPDTDLAVVQIQAAPDDLTALEFGDSDAVAVGQPVMALGNPLGLSNTVTVGIVSALDRPVTTQNASSTPGEAATPVVTNAIQTDAAVNPGNSGGALVDDAGQLVGINSSIATLGASEGGQGGSIGLGFAIPSNEAEWVARQLIETGDVDHAYLGVSLESAIVSVDGVARQGAGITDVAEGTAAAEGGLQAGEAITQVDGETVRGADSLIAQIREREPGTRVTLTVVSEGGDTREVSVEFGTRDEP
jgi:putative serine protease PepD